MHLSTILATAAAVVPSVSALAIEDRSSYLGSTVLANSAWANQQDYNRKKQSNNTWATCNSNNIIVRKEWYATESQVFAVDTPADINQE